MAGIKVMKLWTAIITAFLAVLTALGFASTATAAPAVQPANESCNGNDTHTAVSTVPWWSVPPLWTSPYKRSLPPTMKQRIRAEAHGSSPRCRRLPSLPADPMDTASATGVTGLPGSPATDTGADAAPALADSR